jgi:hypothetical protein
MPECSRELMRQGKPYPRTCAVHGLFGCVPPQVDRTQDQSARAMVDHLIEQGCIGQRLTDQLWCVLLSCGAKLTPTHLRSIADELDRRNG